MSPSVRSNLDYDSFEDFIPTAAGRVSSPKSFVKARLVLNLKDRQQVSSEWWDQYQRDPIIGIVSAYVDVNGGRDYNLSDCAITHVELGGPTTIIIDGTIANDNQR